MKLVALMPVRNEGWVLGLSARAALRWCDELVILLHACTDESEWIMREVCREHRGRVLLLAEPMSKWDEMEHRQWMLDGARHRGATHIATVDADEILTGNLSTGTAREVLRGAIENAIRPGGSVLYLPGYNLRGSIHRYHSNGVWANRWFSVAFQDDARLGWSGDRFHAREPQGMALHPSRPVRQGEGGILHLWGASERRLRAKHALYKLTERLRWPAKPVNVIERMYNLAVYGHRGVPGHDADAWTYADVPASWWEPYRDLLRYLNVDAVPWQEQESRRLVAEHGAAAFAGLDLFGVA